MKLGQRLLLTVLAVLTFAMASHQAMASTQSAAPCIQEIHVSADGAHAEIDIDHCVTCCQTGQALAFPAGTLAFESAVLQVAVPIARYTDTERALADKLLRPPRLV